MWLPGNSELCLYNIADSKGYRSVLRNVFNSEDEAIYDLPIYDITSDGKTAVSLNFSRLHNVRPGYGYVNFKDKNYGKTSPNNDGIWVFKLKDNKYELLLSLKKINSFIGIDSDRSSQCIDYVNHLRFSPDNKKLYFYYVWKFGKNNLDRDIFPIVYDFESNKLKIVTREMISHECWKDKDQLLLWSNDSFSYNLYNIKDDTMTSYKKEIFNQDGHPNFITDDEFITDTYPNRLGYQKLLYYKNKLEVLGKFHVPYYLNGEIRCDLHPRTSIDKNKVAVDIFHQGFRKICLLDLYE
jgi:hypothetical protein